MNLIYSLLVSAMLTQGGGVRPVQYYTITNWNNNVEIGRLQYIGDRAAVMRLDPNWVCEDVVGTEPTTEDVRNADIPPEVKLGVQCVYTPPKPEPVEPVEEE